MGAMFLSEFIYCVLYLFLPFLLCTWSLLLFWHCFFRLTTLFICFVSIQTWWPLSLVTESTFKPSHRSITFLPLQRSTQISERSSWFQVLITLFPFINPTSKSVCILPQLTSNSGFQYITWYNLLVVKIFTSFFPVLLTAFSSTLSIQVGLALAGTVRGVTSTCHGVGARSNGPGWPSGLIAAPLLTVTFALALLSPIRDNNARRTW